MTQDPVPTSNQNGAQQLHDLVKLIAQALVDEPAAVQINMLNARTSIILELRVAPNDVGKIIGKGGQNVRAIRQILDAAATKQHKKSMLQILEK